MPGQLKHFYGWFFLLVISFHIYIHIGPGSISALPCHSLSAFCKLLSKLKFAPQVKFVTFNKLQNQTRLSFIKIILKLKFGEDAEA